MVGGKECFDVATCLNGEALEVYKSLNEVDSTSGSRILRKGSKKVFEPSIASDLLEMTEETREQLLFEQYIRGLPKFVYENIRKSPDVRIADEKSPNYYTCTQ